jgi:hypothetical protein
MRFRGVMVVMVALCYFALAPVGRIAAQDGESGHPAASSMRLLRIGQMIDRRIAAGDVPGTVSLVAIDGRIVHFEARGVLDVNSKRPMAKDAIFSLACSSSSKKAESGWPTRCRDSCRSSRI